MKLKQPQTLTCCQLAENQARLNERKRIREIIENERDNGNCNDRSFSAAICISRLLRKELLDVKKEMER